MEKDARHPPFPTDGYTSLLGRYYPPWPIQPGKGNICSVNTVAAQFVMGRIARRKSCLTRACRQESEKLLACCWETDMGDFWGRPFQRIMDLMCSVQSIGVWINGGLIVSRAERKNRIPENLTLRGHNHNVPTRGVSHLNFFFHSTKVK